MGGGVLAKKYCSNIRSEEIWKESRNDNLWSKGSAGRMGSTNDKLQQERIREKLDQEPGFGILASFSEQIARCYAKKLANERFTIKTSNLLIRSFFVSDNSLKKLSVSLIDF